MTRVRETMTVDSPFSATIDFAAKFFAHHSLPLTASIGERTAAMTTFRVVVDVADGSRFHHALRLEIAPRAGPLVPRFTALLSVRPYRTKTTLRLEGSYEAPLGGVGRIVDRVVGERIARETVRALLRELGTFVEAEWVAFRRRTPDIATLNRRRSAGSRRV